MLQTVLYAIWYIRQIFPENQAALHLSGEGTFVSAFLVGSKWNLLSEA